MFGKRSKHTPFLPTPNDTEAKGVGRRLKGCGWIADQCFSILKTHPVALFIVACPIVRVYGEFNQSDSHACSNTQRMDDRPSAAASTAPRPASSLLGQETTMEVAKAVACINI